MTLRLDELEEEATTDLTTADRAELGRYEAVIGRGLQTFVEVGNALAAIRDGKLYRGTHGTFLDYCRERWDLGRSHVYRLMDAAEVVANLGESSPIGDVSESVMRPLTALDPEQQREAYAKAVKDAPSGKPTAADVAKAATTFAEPKPPKAKPEVVAYAPIYRLETKLKDWLAKEEREAEGNPDTLLDSLHTSYPGGARGATFVRLEADLVADGIHLRKSDLIQAINNVRDQRRQAQRQASAKKVYVEPRVAPGSANDPTPEDLAAAGYRIVRSQDDSSLWMWLDADGAYGDAWPIEQAIIDARKRIELAPQVEAVISAAPSTDDAPTSTEIKADDIVATLIREPGANQKFVDALEMASLGQLREAFAAVAARGNIGRSNRLEARILQLEHDQPTPDELAAIAEVAAELAEEDGERAERAATRTNPADNEPFVSPDPRLARVVALRDGLLSVRDLARADYHDLTGMGSDLLEFERGIAKMLPRLSSLIGILESNVGKP